MSNNTEQQYQVKSMVIVHEGLQRLSDAYMEEYPGTTRKDALGKVVDNLLEAKDSNTRVEELEAANKALTLQLEELNSAYSQALRNLDSLGEELQVVRNRPLPIQFCDLGELVPEAAAYIDDVSREMLATGMHHSVAHWVLNMLYIMQKSHKGYIPSSRQIVDFNWISKLNKK